MAMSAARKRSLRDEIAERFKKSNATIVAEYRGLSVEQLTDLRVKLRESQSEFRIIKNRIAKVAIDQDFPEGEALKDSLVGPIGVVFVYGDAAAAAKTLLEFSKDKENFKVTSGMMEGNKVSNAELKAIAELPSKDVLLARIVGTLVSPHRGLLTVLSGIPRQLVQVINAIKDTKTP